MSLPTILAVRVDRLVALGLATVTETSTAMTVAQLGAAEADTLLPVLRDLAWGYTIVDNACEIADETALTKDYAPFILTVEKPQMDGIFSLVSLSGLRAFLTAERSQSICQIGALSAPFATIATEFRPWGSNGIFSPGPETKIPRELVRENNIPPQAPGDIRTWLLRANVSESLWSDHVFQVFAELSTQALMKSVSGEIKADGSMLFKGPPLTRLERPGEYAAQELGLGGYNDLRNAVAWVYENAIEAERRHALFVAEFGATHISGDNAASAFRNAAASVLQGAKLAYQLSLSDVTREAIKAQGDLRKAVADDAAKLADNTRQVATAVAAALATSTGLIAAKIGTTAPHWVIQVLAMVVFVYVGAVIASGWAFMSVQRDMRAKWRTRLYRFIPDPDYKAMVLDPAHKSETMFRAAAIAGGIIAASAVAVAFLL